MKALLTKGIPCLFIAFLSTTALFAQSSSVTIGPGAIKSNAVLWLVPTGGQGLLLPSLTTAARTGMGLNASEDKGMMVYDNQLNKVFYWNGSAWTEVGAGAGGSDSQDLTLTGTTLSLTNDASAVTLGALAILNTVASAQITDATITNADIATSAAIAVNKLAAGTNNQVLTTVGGVPTWTTASAGTDSQDLTLAGTTISLTNDATPIALGALSILNSVSGGATGTITDGTIINADISSSAAIDITKLNSGGAANNGLVLKVVGGALTFANDDVGGGATPTLGTGQVLVGNGTTNSAATVAGDLTMTNGNFQIASGAVSATELAAGSVSGGAAGTITDGSIVNADISTAAAIAVTKIAPGANTQVLTTVGGVPTWAAAAAGSDSQDLTLAGTTLSLTNDATPVTLGALAILATVNSATIADGTVASVDILDGTVASADITDATIVNADVATGAAIAVSKLAAGTNTQVLTTVAGVPTWAAATAGSDSQDLTLAGTTLSLTNDGTPVTLGALSILATVNSATIADGTVASVDILDGTVASADITDATIVNADVATGAAIAVSKLAAGTNTQVLTTVGGVPTWSAPAASSDAQDLSLAGTTLSLTNDGTPVTLGALSVLGAVSGGASGTISDGTITSADLAAGSVSGGIGGIITDGTIVSADLAAGAVSGGAAGTITDGTIINADISAAAAIAVTKLAAGTNTQVLTTVAGVPTWSAPAVSTDNQDLSLAGTTLSLTNDGTPVVLGNLAVVNAVDLTSAQVTNTLGVANGGTGRTTWDGLLVGNGATINDISTGTNGQILKAVAGSPSWQNFVVTNAEITDGTITGADLATNISIATTGNITTNAPGNLSIAGTSTLSGTATLSSLAGSGTRMVVADPTGVLSTQSIPSGTALSTNNVIPKGNGTSQVASSLTDNGTTVSTTLDMNVATGKAYMINNVDVLRTVGASGLTFVGDNAGPSATGNHNTFIGVESGTNTVGGQENVFVGRRAGYSNTNSYNVYVGKNAGYFNVGSGLNTMVGWHAGYNAPQANGGSTFIGAETGAVSTADYNTFVGERSGVANTTGDFNTFLGRRSGYINQTGSLLTLIGHSADVTVQGLSNATAIGYNAKVSANSSLILGGTGADVVNVGIGVTAPTTDLHVVHANGSAANDGFTIQNIGANNESWTFFVSNATGNLAVYDNFTNLRGQFDDSNGNYTPTSDRRLKKNILDIESVLPKISMMQIRRYHFKTQKDSEQTNIGVIAQELKEVFPELVKYMPENDLYTVDYTSMAPLAIKAIQEQQDMIDKLKTQVAELEASLKKEKSTNEQLNSKVEALAGDIEYIKRSVGLDQKAKK